MEGLGAIATSVAPGGGPTVAPAVLMALAGACRERVHQATVLVHAPRHQVEGRPWAWGRVEAVDAATCRLHTGDDELDWLLLRLLMIGHPITVEGPPALATGLAALADRLGGAAARSAPGA